VGRGPWTASGREPWTASGEATAMADHGVRGVAAMGDEALDLFFASTATEQKGQGGYLENNQSMVGGSRRCFP
jgi:hypothetical protein